MKNILHITDSAVTGHLHYSLAEGYNPVASLWGTRHEICVKPKSIEVSIYHDKISDSSDTLIAVISVDEITGLV